MSKFKLLAAQPGTRVMQMWCPTCNRMGARRLTAHQYLRWCLDLPLAWIDGRNRRAKICSACEFPPISSEWTLLPYKFKPYWYSKPI